MRPSEFYRGRKQDMLTFAVWPSRRGFSLDLCGSVPKVLTQDHSENFGQSREVTMLSLPGHLYVLL